MSWMLRDRTDTHTEDPTPKYIGLRQEDLPARKDLDEDHLCNPIQEEKNMIKKHEF
ncbi:MAG: hypothetical protein QGH26_04230 [Candidatus Pacebacteria bacterium]|jgi:hypothetical protein|nr:hypothetical protein [Candidatus Paceibacterota bacterium]|tara:strand:- start:89 stop:256 length:168 start_codon:yes stop_codon:yes gene_type:complete